MAHVCHTVPQILLSQQRMLREQKLSGTVSQTS